MVPFRRRHFQIFFYENGYILIQFQLEIVPNGSIKNIPSDNGSVTNRRQAIIWTNEGLSYRC